MAVPLIPVIARFLGGFLVKQGTKTAVKQGVKTIAKKNIKKAAAKKVTKTAAKKAAAKKAVGGAATTVGTTGKKNIFNKAISKIGLIGGTAWGVSELFQTAGSVLSTTLTSSGFVVPAVLGAAAGTYGFYKISKITRNKSKQDKDHKSKQDKGQKKNDTTQVAFVEYSEPVPLEKMSPKHLRQIKKMSPAQIQALRAKKYKRATAKLEKEGTQLENSKKLQNVLRARQYENAA